MPCRTCPALAAAAVALALALASSAAQARRPDADDWEADARREFERDERSTVRDSTRGWTWAAMGKIDHDDDREPYNDDSNPRRPLVRVTALAADASGNAIVGGGVRGPLRLGTTSVGMTQQPRGFIARVNRAGGFHMIQLAERETFMQPSALAIDRGGHIVASYEDGKLATLTREGRPVWSRDLPPARALAIAPGGDILAAGCWIIERRESSPWSKQIFNVTEIREGYVARISRRRAGQVDLPARSGAAGAVLSTERPRRHGLRQRDRAGPGR